MELEVGMYVRFDWKKQQLPILIGKITEVHYDEDEKYYFYLTDNGLVIGEDNLVKEPSFNPIDLIQVGDYVNGLKITLINEPSMANCYKRIVYAEDREGYLIESFNENDIKSIVTKEQFESMQYRIGE